MNFFQTADLSALQRKPEVSMRHIASRRTFALNFLSLAACAAFARGALAQNASPKLESLLRRTLNAIQAGSPNYLDMEPLLADQVEQQLTPMRQRFDSLGSIRTIEFRGMQSTQAGPAEYYRVLFDNGQMVWLINLTPAQKIGVLWSPG